jgi:DNA-binding CsgD family transcriptional regulator
VITPTENERYVNVPTFIFKDRTLAALEAIVIYLKDSQGMTYAQIAKLLNRDQRTIWTTYSRAKQKLQTSTAANTAATDTAANKTKSTRSKRPSKQSTGGAE